MFPSNILSFFERKEHEKREFVFGIFLLLLSDIKNDDRFLRCIFSFVLLAPDMTSSSSSSIILHLCLGGKSDSTTALVAWLVHNAAIST